MADGLFNKASIILTPTGYKAGTLYNVAPVVEPYEDFDFARASVASRVNSSGLVEMVGRTLGSELVTNGDFSTSGTPNTSSFTLGWYSNTSNVIIENGSLTMSNSASESDSRAYATNGVSSNNILTTNKTYELKYDIIENNGVTNFKYYSSSGIFISAPSVEIGSYTIYIKNTSNQLFLFQNSSTNSSIKIDNVSVKEIIDTNNIPRINYDSNGDNGHILLEPTSTNLITYSEDFTQWSKEASVTLTSNYGISPDGTQNSTRMQMNADDSLYISTSSGLTASFYVKGTLGETIRLSNGSAITHTLTGNWDRVETYDSSSASSLISINTYSGATARDIEIWGAQAEALSYATSYIPTLTGSTVTRATETATGAGSATLINSTEGVLYAEIAALAEESASKRITISDGSLTNRITLSVAGNIISGFINVNNVTQYTFFESGQNITSFNKIAVKYKANDFALWINGVEYDISTSGSIFSANTLNVINFANATITDNDFYGKVKALAVFNEALSDAELNNLTG